MLLGLGAGLQIVGSLTSSMLSPTSGGFGSLFTGILSNKHKLMNIDSNSNTMSSGSGGHACSQDGVLTCLNNCIDISSSSVNQTCAQLCTTVQCGILVNNNQTMDVRQMYNSLSALGSLNTIYNNDTIQSSTMSTPSLSSLFGNSPVGNIDMSTVSNLATSSSMPSCSECIGNAVSTNTLNTTLIGELCLPHCIALQSINSIQSSTQTPVSNTFIDFLHSLSNMNTGSMLTPFNGLNNKHTLYSASSSMTSNLSDTVSALMPLVMSGQLLNGVNAAFGNLTPLTLLSQSAQSTINSNQLCNTVISSQPCTLQCLSSTDNTNLRELSECITVCGSSPCVIPDVNQMNTMRVASLLQTAAL